MRAKLSILILLFLFTEGNCGAQNLQYNIDQYHGLPSNRVYNAMVDHLRYLWFSTPEGLVKYNGYEEKLINSLDSWELFEDSKGRLWQSTRSSELGYLKNDKYVKVPIENFQSTIQPMFIGEFGDRLFFPSLHRKELIVERDGRAKKYQINGLLTDAIFMPHTDSTFLLVNGGAIFRLNLRNMAFTMIGRHHIDLTKKTLIAFGDRLFLHDIDNGRSYNYDIKSDRLDSFKLYTDPREYIYNVDRHEHSWDIVTNKNYYTLADSIGLVTKASYHELLPQATGVKTLISSILKNNIWGTVITTSSSGAYINFRPVKHHLLKERLYEAVYVGKSETVDGYWWDNISHHLIDIKDGIVGSHTVPAAKNIRKLIPYAPGMLFAFTNNNFFVLSEKTMQTKHWDFKGLYIPGVKDCYLQDTNTVYVLSVNGLHRLKITGDMHSKKIIDSGAYEAMAFDPLRKQLVLHDQHNLMVYDIKSGKKRRLNETAFVMPRLDKIFFDDYGNIFIKSEDDLYLYSRRNKTLIPVFQNTRLEGAHISVYKNLLVTAGKFGVAICRIACADSISAQYLYENAKNSYYEHVYGLQTSSAGILLNTDKGAMALSYPSPENVADRYEAGRKKVYRMLASYGDTTVVMRQSDTLFIQQTNTSLVLDIVNPLGVGKLFFLSSFDRPFKQSRLNSNEIQLSGLAPGRFHTLYITAKDDVWKSDLITLKIFMVPYWYQTGIARKLFIAGVIILLLLLIGMTYYFTRKAVNKKNWQQRLMLEFNNLKLDFELKSIHNQINPHFIFNTLNTSLYFIQKKKLEEAYSHISAFSDLLRSYLASSKNKFIRLPDEIENLRNYIMLQQARFEDRFTYRIDVSTNSEPKEIMIPPFLLQPMIENAINHGLLPKEDGVGDLHISFKTGANKNILICTIDDNGIGRERAMEYRDSSTNRVHGDDLIKELIEYYNRYEKVYISMQYIDKQHPDTGTTVIITIKKTGN